VPLGLILETTQGAPGSDAKRGHKFVASASNGCLMDRFAQYEGTGRVVRVPLSEISRDPRGWPRHKLDPERVAEFYQLYLDQGFASLPLMEVIPDGEGGYLLAEGNHRYEALSQTNVEELDVLVLASPPPGVDPQQVCFERGLVTAATSALRLTRAEKHNAILTLSETRAELSHHEIASLVGCSHQTVGRVLSRSNGPEDEGEQTYQAPPSDLDVATSLFLGIEKVYEARGIGLWDAITGDHTGERLAGVLTDAYGDDALRRAKKFRLWCDDAIRELRRRS